MYREAPHELGAECSRPRKQHVQMPCGGDVLGSSRKWKASHCCWNASQGETSRRWEFESGIGQIIENSVNFIRSSVIKQRWHFIHSSCRGGKVVSLTVDRLSRRLKRWGIRAFTQNGSFPPDLLNICHMFSKLLLYNLSHQSIFIFIGKINKLIA